MKKKTGLLVLMSLFLGAFAVGETSGDKVCAVYFTGVGCPHCAKTDPIILQQLPGEYNGRFIVLEYEIYQQQGNAQLMYEYNTKLESGLGVPQIVFSGGECKIGDKPILDNVRDCVNQRLVGDGRCQLLDKAVPFSEVDLNNLAGKPKVWVGKRILMREENGEDTDNTILFELLTCDSVEEAMENLAFDYVEPESVPLSGKNIEFRRAAKLGGWVLQWNDVKEQGDVITGEAIHSGVEYSPETENKGRESSPGSRDLSTAKILSLAAVDAVNPCALAVLTLMLIAILTYNPKDKRNVLLAGLAFTLSVYVLYMFYGLVIIRFFQLVQMLTSVRLWLYKILGLAAIILGILNMKDFFSYKPGGLMTEMPLSMRPKLKKLIGGVTSPKGAFFVGAFVTVFLLPCTIGPYVIAGGILSALDLMKTIPWLMVYNAIFVLPMAVITLLVYWGVTKVEDVSGWKDNNIRYLHLIAGTIMAGLGVAMLGGWV